jgi:DNA-binding transcriptional LysR family regulator/protein-tyrosine-phosphatase
MERLDLRLVEYFVAVAEELHFGRAAARLHIAQPSLSQQIRRLEAQLGVSLLERNSRNVHLTLAGQALLQEGRKTLSQARHTIQAVRSAGAPRLTVGFYGSAASELLPDVLRAFSERLPRVDVSVRELLLGSIDDILDGSVDIAFTRMLPGQTELEVEVLTEEPRLAALASTDPLANRQTLTFADLRDESFIINPVARHDGPPPRWLAEQRRHELPGRIAAQATSLQEILALVAAGRGVCLLPQAVARHHPRAGVTYVPVTDADPAVVSLAWRPEPISPAVNAFIEASRQIAARHPESHLRRDDLAFTTMSTALFVCLHNAGRSQMSQALFERAAGGRHYALSAGTTPAERIHPEVIEVMRELNIDLANQKPKLLTRELAEQADVVVTMGCGDSCPFIPGKRYVDWDLPDPKGRPIAEVRATRDEIARRVKALVAELDL